MIATFAGSNRIRMIEPPMRPSAHRAVTVGRADIVAHRYPIEVGGEDFRIDLLFYHLKLRCFVVTDL